MKTPDFFAYVPNERAQWPPDQEEVAEMRADIGRMFALLVRAKDQLALMSNDSRFVYPDARRLLAEIPALLTEGRDGRG